MADHSPSKLMPEVEPRDVVHSPVPVHSAQPCSWYGCPWSRETLVEQPQMRAQMWVCDLGGELEGRPQ